MRAGAKFCRLLWRILLVSMVCVFIAQIGFDNKSTADKVTVVIFKFFLLPSIGGWFLLNGIGIVWRSAFEMKRRNGVTSREVSPVLLIGLIFVLVPVLLAIKFFQQ